MREEVPKTIKFYDTNALLHNTKEIEGIIYVSSVTLKELESIKTSKNKSEEVKFNARKVTRFLKENEDKYKCVIVNKNHYEILEDKNLESNNDNLIMACAYEVAQNNNLVFITNDLCCYNIAKNIFNLRVENNKDLYIKEYTGYKEIIMTDDELANWYENKENKWDLINNQYLLVKNENEEVIDHYRYVDSKFEPIKAKDIKSSYLGRFKPIDKQQLIAVDSLSNNQITMIKGKSGTGKSLIATSFLFSQLEKNKIDKVIIFCNTVQTRGAARLGFYKGTKDDKLLDSQIGNFLSSKFGDKLALQLLISQGKLVLLPMCDIRGYDTSGMKAGVYITEAQNMNIDMMKLALQRIGEDCICIIDGDYNTQVDDVNFEGNNNGMRRMSEVFKGQSFYGEVELNTIHRSKIAEIADLM